MDLELSTWTAEAERMTDSQLMAQLQRVASTDRKLVARMIVYLLEVDSRGLYREQAYSSLFSYAVEELRMSESEAYLRIYAARLARQYPIVIEWLAAGAVSLTTLKLIGPRLTVDNHRQLLERVRGKSKREVERVVAEVHPMPDVPSRMRKLPASAAGMGRLIRADLAITADGASAAETCEPTCSTPAEAGKEIVAAPGQRVLRNDTPTVSAFPADRCSGSGASRGAAHSARSAPDSTGATPPGSAAAAHATADLVAGAHAAADGAAAARAAADVAGKGGRDSVEPSSQLHDAAGAFALEAPRAQRGSCTPLRPGRYKVEFTASQQLHDKLKQVQQLLRHQIPDGDLAIIIERAVGQLLEQTLKQRFARLSPRSKTAGTRSAGAGAGATEVRKRAGSSWVCVKARCVGRAEEVGEVSGGGIRSTGPVVTHDIEGRRGPRGSALSNEAAHHSRYVPRAVLREIHGRDGEQCTFVSASGRRCSERGFLEVHHVEAYAKGGMATAGNLRLVCRTHNALFAERDFGADFMRARRQGV